MNKKLFLLFVVALVFVFAPSVYAAELVCDVDKAEMGTCTVTYDETTTKATVVIEKRSEFAEFGTPSLVSNGAEVEAEFEGTPVTSGNTKTYVITNALPTSKVKANLHFKKYMYIDPECETGGGTIEVDPPSPVPYSDTLTLIVKPDSCYELETLRVEGISSHNVYEPVSVEGNVYKYNMPAEDIKIVARFKKKANCTDPTPTATPTATPTPTPTPKPEGDVKVPDTDTYSYLTTFITLLVISSVGFVLYKKVS